MRERDKRWRSAVCANYSSDRLELKTQSVERFVSYRFIRDKFKHGHQSVSFPRDIYRPLVLAQRSVHRWSFSDLPADGLCDSFIGINQSINLLVLVAGMSCGFSAPIFNLPVQFSFWYFSVIGRHRSRPHGRPQFFFLPPESINYRGHLLHAWSKHRSVFQCSRFMLTTFHSRSDWTSKNGPSCASVAMTSLYNFKLIFKKLELLPSSTEWVALASEQGLPLQMKLYVERFAWWLEDDYSSWPRWLAFIRDQKDNNAKKRRRRK